MDSFDPASAVTHPSFFTLRYDGAALIARHRSMSHKKISRLSPPEANFPSERSDAHANAMT
jgi:hypothetical protein